MVTGKIRELGVKRFRGGRQSVFEMVIEDASGRMRCRWWNMPRSCATKFKRDDELVVIGKVRSHKPIAMDHPNRSGGARR